MGSTARFILACMVAITALGSGSLMWPRLSDKPRPKVLQNVHDLVLRTEVGQNAANVLGVSDEANVQKINFGEIASRAVGNARTAVQNRVRTVVVTNAVNSLSRRFDALPVEQKEQIQQILCKPAE